MSKKNPNEGKTLKYSEKDLNKALDAVAEGMSYGKASRTYGVPKTTILYKFNGKYPVKCRMGPPTVLSTLEEKLLSDWILHMQKCGFPITKFQLLESVQKLLNALKRETMFTNNRPGRDWYDRFLKRNPEITERVYQNLTRARSSVTELQIRNWFAEVHTYMEEKDYLNVLEDPKRVFNMDETAFFLTPADGRVLAKKGSKTVYSFVQNDEKECLTALIGSNADGKFVPPMVVFPYVRIPERIGTTVPSGWGIGRSESGWMTGELFFEYIANIFHPWLLENNIELPVVLFIDGHTSHLTLALSDFCSDHGIILVALYPNATHIIQPMDVGLFHALKVYWRRRVFEFRLKENGKKVQREDFCVLLQDIMQQIKDNTLRNAFTACGLFPFNADAIKYAKVIKSTNVAETIEEEMPPIKQPKDEGDNLTSYQFFEKYIAEKLDSFMSAGSIWNGALEDKSLFDVWKKMCGDLNITHQHYILVPFVDVNELAGEDIQIGNLAMLN